MFKDALDKMKVATRQYAKSQVKWITTKTRAAVRERTDAAMEGLFVLDASGKLLSSPFAVVDEFD